METLISTVSLVTTYRAARPGPGWHAHGTTAKTVRIWEDSRTIHIRVLKQRWLHVETGRTRHDRPPWDLLWARSGVDVVFLVLGAWLLGPHGVHRAETPIDPPPVPRTAQRWLDRIRRQAASWHQAIRLALIDLLSPRPLEEIVPVGGIPPPGRRWRTPKSETVNAVSQLQHGLWLTTRGAEVLPIPVRTLLVEAMARWPGNCPTIPAS
jgi:hypothetical protein